MGRDALHRRVAGQGTDGFVPQDAIDDPGEHRQRQTNEVHLETFDKHRGEVLDGAAKPLTNPENFDTPAERRRAVSAVTARAPCTMPVTRFAGT